MDQEEMGVLLEIQQVTARYMVLSARKQHDHWLEVFTPDGTYSAFGTSYSLDDFPKLLDSAPPGQYIGSTPVVEVHGDSATGVQHYVFIDQVTHEMRLAWYDDEYRQRPTRPPVAIESEQSVKAGLSNKPGTIAMARTSDPNSATAQFFINVADNKRLDFRSPDPQGYGYTVFGKVIAGMDVVEKIAKVATGPGGPFPSDVPKEHVVIKSARVITPAN